MRTLHAYLNGRRIGILSEGDDLWRFEYDAEWTESPDGFDLSPALSRATPLHVDGGSLRPVQWYFDNLLPEETLREALIKESGIKGDDAFALLEYLGAESAGSLVLLPPGMEAKPPGGIKPLADEDLSRRIRDLPRQSLSTSAPKRMSVAGAQHKLLVVYRDGELFEPVGSEPSTHILKPDHLSDDYVSSVINEYAMQRLGALLEMGSPPVYRKYVPEPVYLIQRFDRFIDKEGATQRRHVIDACQLLNKSRSFKNTSATLQTLADCIDHCRAQPIASLRLYRWLVFNLLIGNDDNHLKNISFMVSNEGIEVAPPYDMLSTAVYHTTAYAEERALWPEVKLMIPLPGAATFGEVTREAVLAAGAALGLSRRISERELGRMSAVMPEVLKVVRLEIEAENADGLPETKIHFAGELRLLRAIEHVVVPFILERVRA